jgi:branched-chain amino acid transport system permease protein
MFKKINNALNPSLRHPLDEQNKRTNKVALMIFLAIVYVFAILLDNVLPANGITLMLIPVLRKGAIYALLCVSMNLLNGFTGLFSLGQAGFMLIGGYVYAILTIPQASHAAVYQYFDGGIFQFSVTEVFGNVLGPFLGNVIGAIICIIIAGLVVAVFAALIGIPVLRLKSDYLAIATLGFAEIIRAIFQWNGIGGITNGSNLLRKYTNLDNLVWNVGSLNINFGTTFAFLIVTLCIVAIILMINSSYGRAFKAIRDDEISAEAMGINLFKHKMLSFVISSFFAGVGGALLAMFQTTIQAAAFTSAMTYEILLIVVIGGIGSVSGSCIAAFLYIACNEWWLRFLDSGYLGSIPVGFFRGGFRKVIFSIIIMVIVLFFSRGIMGDKELSFTGLLNKIKQFKNRKALKQAAEKEGE